MAVNATQSQPTVPCLLRVCQINLNNCCAANSEVARLAAAKKWDVLLLQEPYIQPNSKTIPGLHGYRVCFAGNPPRAAIAVTNPGLSLFFHQNLSDQYIAVATVSSATDKFVFVSAYHKGRPRNANRGDNANTQDLQRLSHVIGAFPSAKLCFAIDANAYSFEWGSEDEDARGSALTEFLAADNLVLLNDGQTPTYNHPTTRANSFIDITVVSPVLSPLIDRWYVSQDITFSDHRYILTEIALTSVPSNVRTHAKRFCVARADWDLLTRLLEEFKPDFRALVETATTTDEIEQLSDCYMEFVGAAARRAIPFSRPFDGSKDWWSPALKSLNKEARRLRNRLKGHHRDYAQRLAASKAAYKAFKKAHDKARFESFKQWCTVDTTDPWGSVYNMLKTKRQLSAPLKPLSRPDGSMTATEQETIDLLLTQYFPSDTTTEDTPTGVVARTVARHPPNTDNDLPFSESEVRATIWRMKTRKSPGFDLITAPILRVIASVLLPEITLWFNKCLSVGCFPSPFKRAVIKFIPKPNSDSITTAKAFRPICLLPTIGKALDSLLIKRIEWFLYTNGRMSDRQFGFVPQKSTVDAVLHAIRLTEQFRARGHCVYLISLDIAGAFDSAKWHFVLSALKARQCPQNLYRLAQHYFADRWVTAETESCAITRQATQGCMQGSPSGPVFWNVLFDDIHRIELPAGCSSQSYADDNFIIVTGGSVKVAAQRANLCLKLIHDWGTKIGLKFNASKTQILNVGRGSEMANKPLILMDGQQVPFTDTIKYLGVILDHQLLFCAHINDACQRTRLAVNRFVRYAGSNWGFGPLAMKTIWTRALEPALTYASPVWAHRAGIDINKRRLKTVQRLALLRATRSYRTVSHEALYTLSGVTPIVLRIQELSAQYHVSRCVVPEDLPTLLIGVQFDRLTPRIPFFTREHPSVRDFGREPPNASFIAARDTIHTALINQWQQQWVSATTGRLTFSFFPDIEQRLANDFSIGHLLSQFLTGHGDFRAYLHRFTLRESPDCSVCSVPDTVAHRLITCSLYDNHRTVFCASVGSQPTTIECFSPILRNANHLELFRTFIRDISRTAAEAGICD